MPMQGAGTGSASSLLAVKGEVRPNPEAYAQSQRLTLSFAMKLALWNNPVGPNENEKKGGGRRAASQVSAEELGT